MAPVFPLEQFRVNREQSQIEYGIIAAQNVMVPMRDGVRLATDVYRPANPDGSPVEGAFPVILGRTSYDKSNPARRPGGAMRY